MPNLETLTGETWEEFITTSPTAVLMLGKTDCAACAAFSKEIEELLAHGGREGVRFAKMYLDTGGLIGFKKANPWLADVTDLPYTVIFKDGQIVKKFAGGGIDRLMKRLDKVV